MRYLGFCVCDFISVQRKQGRLDVRGRGGLQRFEVKLLLGVFGHQLVVRLLLGALHDVQLLQHVLRLGGVGGHR